MYTHARGIADILHAGINHCRINVLLPCRIGQPTPSTLKMVFKACTLQQHCPISSTHGECARIWQSSTRASLCPYYVGTLARLCMCMGSYDCVDRREKNNDTLAAIHLLDPHFLPALALLVFDVQMGACVCVCLCVCCYAFFSWQALCSDRQSSTATRATLRALMYVT